MFWFCKKKKEVELKWEYLSRAYDGKDVMVDLPEAEADSFFSKFMEPAVPKTSCWWNSLPNGRSWQHRIKQIKSQLENSLLRKDEVHNFDESDMEQRTAKSCPAILSFLNNCYSIKFPVDVILSIDDKGDVISSTPNSNFLSIATHPPHQYKNLKENDLFAKYTNVKFQFPAGLSSPNNPYLFMPSMYHNQQPYIVPPGKIDTAQSNWEELNLNTFFSLPSEGEVDTYHFKAGDIAAYVYFEKKIDKVTYCDYSLRDWKYFTKGFLWSKERYDV